MKKLIYLLLIGSALQSCTHSIPLKGKYQEGAVKSRFNDPFDKVWERAIDFIAESGVSVQLIDKASGLILADVASFYGYTTIEDKKGKLKDPDAYIVAERFTNQSTNPEKYYVMSGRWNMRIKANSDGSTDASVNLHSINGKHISMNANAKSTGNFEKRLLHELSK